MRSTILLLFALAVSAAHAADAPAPARPKDAAEAVQEGNVDNWLKYYQRERGQTATPAAPPAPSPPQADPQPADRR